MIEQIIGSGKWRQQWKGTLILRGCQKSYMRKINSPCVACKQFQGNVLRPATPPFLLEFRVAVDFPFQVAGSDFAEPLYVKNCYF